MRSRTHRSSEAYINGRYRILRKLGEGAMGSVHLVVDTLDDDRLVALKTVRGETMTPQSEKLFRDEFAAMTQLRHPNVVEVYDFGTVSGTVDRFFTMEFVEGRNLLDAGQSASPQKIYEIAAQICRALEYIHAQGFTHFDLKPDNIMVGASGIVKVMDFGLVEKGSFFQARLLKGTIAYIAPEMIDGKKVDHRLDLYSLGAVLFHVVTGRVLFTGETMVQILRRHLRDKPNLRDEQLRPIPEPLQLILERLLEKNPDDRYASATDVLADLERVLEREAPRDTRDVLTRAVLGSRLVGRDAELSRLKEAFHYRVVEPAAAQEAAPILFITGESGMGKSRLMQEFRHYVQLSGVRFLQGSCLQNGGHSYLPFAEMLRTLTREIISAPSSDITPMSGAMPVSEALPTPESLPTPETLFISETVHASDALPLTEVQPASEARSALEVEPPPTKPAAFTRSSSEQVDIRVRSEDSAPHLLNFAMTIDSQSWLPPVALSGPRKNSPDATTMWSTNSHSQRLLSLQDPVLTLLSYEASAEDLRALLRASASAISMLVPEDDDLRALAKNPPREAQPGRDKDWLLESITRFFIEAARSFPLVLYCSDMHWADELTVELIARLGHAATEASRAHANDAPPRLLICGCFRKDEIAGTPLEKDAEDLVFLGSAQSVDLLPLKSQDVAEMLESMLGRVELDEEALAILVERTRGVPFSIEATIQDALENHAIVRRGVSWVPLADELRSALAPTTVTQALDRTLLKLSEQEISVLRLLAVLNRPVSPPLLREAGDLVSSGLSQILSRLRKRHLLQRGWAGGQFQWSFRHAQLRDHVYSAIDPVERATLHGEAGAAIERFFPGAERYAEDLAQHFQRAGNADKAIRYLKTAGDQAKRVHDLRRALSLYAQAIDTLDALPETPERDLMEADLAVAVAEVSYYSPSPRNGERLKRALDIATRAGDKDRCAQIQNWLGRTYYALGRHQEAALCFQELMRLTEGTDDDQTRALPFSVLGRVYVFMGRFEQARDYLERGSALLRRQPDCEEDLSYLLGMLGANYVYLGDVARAKTLINESIEIAERLSHSTRIAQGYVYLGIVQAIQGEWQVARERLERGVESALRDANVIGAGTGSSFLGLTYLAEGDARRAVELCRFARDHIKAAGGTWTFSMIGAHLAEALLANGEIEAALTVAKETIPVITEGELWGASCLYIALGRIQARLSDDAEARKSFDKALEVADVQQRSPTFAAKAYLAKGAFLLERGAHEEGTALVLHARASLERLGMTWYQARADKLLAGSPDPSPCP